MGFANRACAPTFFLSGYVVGGCNPATAPSTGAGGPQLQRRMKPGERVKVAAVLY
jgi:hypothetical protein